MFKELVAAWRERNALSLMLDRFDQMLAHDQWMFHRASDAYWRKLECEDLQPTLYARDKQVNELERAIRGEVARHLIVHPGEDVVACLIIRTFGELKRRCDRIVEQLLRQKGDMPTDEAVSYGMLARHMKRIAAHLSNIASSVVTPVENLDFADESELAKP